MSKTTPLSFNQFRIFLDLDGVMCDWLGAVCTLFGINQATPEIKSLILSTWDGVQKIITEKALWAKIDAQGDNFWADLKMFPWSDELYTELKNVAPVCFLTQPSDNPMSAAGKIRWIKSHFGTDDFLLGAPKFFCANHNAVLIDDSDKKLRSFKAAGGLTYCWPHAYDMISKDSWKKEIESVVKQMKDYRDMKPQDRAAICQKIPTETERSLRLLLNSYGSAFTVGSKVFTKIEHWESFFDVATEEEMVACLNSVRNKIGACHAAGDHGL